MRRGRFALAAVAALAVAAVVVLLLGRHDPAAVQAPVAADRAAAALPASAPASDAFTDWEQGDREDGGRFLASDTAHTGAAALLVTAPSGAPDTTMSQSVAVTSDGRLRLTVWAGAEGASAGAVRIEVAGGATASIAVPAGSYDWTRLQVDTVVPPAVHAVTVRIVSPAGATGAVRIDDVALQGAGSRGVVVGNAGFEDNSADLSLTDPSLLLPVDHAALHLATRRGPAGSFRWSLTPTGDGRVLRGAGALVDGRARVGLEQAPPGYYRLRLAATVGGRRVERATDLGLVAPAPGLHSRLLGVGVHPVAGPDLERQVADMARLGVGFARTDADWAASEPEPGVLAFPQGLTDEVQALEGAGIRPLLIPDYANPRYDGGRTPSSPAGLAAYARYAAAVARRFPDADLDVYNEFDFHFNDGACGRTPACYLQLLHPASAAIRAVGAHGAIAGPSTAGMGVGLPWLQGFLDGGGLDDIDALSLHPYVQPGPPEDLESDLVDLQARLRTVAPGRSVPLWFTEFGYSTVPGWVSEPAQAELLVRTVGVALAHGVTRLYWYDLVDDGALPLDLESHFGLFGRPRAFAPAALRPKPAAVAFAVAARAVAAGGELRPEAAPVPGLRVMTTGAGDAAVRLLWSTSGAVRVRLRGAASITSLTGAALRPGEDGAVEVAAPIWVRGAVAVDPPG